MDIDFTGEYLVNDQDVIFYAIADNQTVASFDRAAQPLSIKCKWLEVFQS
jgi:hypothetical protein